MCHPDRQNTGILDMTTFILHIDKELFAHYIFFKQIRLETTNNAALLKYLHEFCET
jgi:hypothetical protein